MKAHRHFCLLAILVAPAVAYPSFYGGCTLPTTALGNHGAPSTDAGIEIVLADSSGSPVTEYSAGQTYTVTASPSSSSRGIIFTDSGSFDASQECEGKKVTWNTGSSSHTATWVAPDTDTATLSVNFASGSSAAYKQNEVTITKLAKGTPSGGSTVIDVPIVDLPSPPPPLPPVTPAPTTPPPATPVPTTPPPATPVPTTPPPSTPVPTTPPPATPVPTTPPPDTPAPTSPPPSTPVPSTSPPSTPASTESPGATPITTPAPSTPVATDPPTTPATTVAPDDAWEPGTDEIVTTIQGTATFSDLEEFTEELESTFIEAVAASAGVDSKYVKIISVNVGSVVVEWSVAVPKDSVANTDDLSDNIIESLAAEEGAPFGPVMMSELVTEEQKLAEFEAPPSSPEPTPSPTGDGDDSSAPVAIFRAFLLVACMAFAVHVLW